MRKCPNKHKLVWVGGPGRTKLGEIVAYAECGNYVRCTYPYKLPHAVLFDYEIPNVRNGPTTLGCVYCFCVATYEKAIDIEEQEPYEIPNVRNRRAISM
jgi:hypothetical protein